MSITLDIVLFVKIIELVENTDVFDVKLWNEIKTDVITDHGQKKYEVIKKILLSGKKYNTDLIVDNREILHCVACCFQALFKLNIQETKEKLLEWLESNNENEGQYLEKAKAVKVVNNVIDGFNNRTETKNMVSSLKVREATWFEGEEKKQNLLIEIIFNYKYE
jgi:hypothetical protein